MTLEFFNDWLRIPLTLAGLVFVVWALGRTAREITELVWGEDKNAND